MTEDPRRQHAFTGAKWLREGRFYSKECGLAMKLINYILDMGISRADMIEYLNTVLWSIPDDWSFAQAASLSYIALIAEPSYGPPEEETLWSQAIPMDQRQQFRQSLSDVQLRSLEILRDWWDGNYQDTTLATAVRSFVRGDPDAALESIDPDSDQCQCSLYHEDMFHLWANEFNPAYWRQGSYRGLAGLRAVAYDEALAQKAGFLVLRALRPDSNQFGLSRRCSQRLPGSVNVCPWLPEVTGKTRDMRKLPLYLWDTEKDQTVRVAELLRNHQEIDYTCISHTWGRWKKKPESFIPVRGVEWAIPENTLFEVTDLPLILRKARTRARLTRLIWFDLVCLPQDTSKPEYIFEVARQATIFRHSS